MQPPKDEWCEQPCHTKCLKKWKDPVLSSTGSCPHCRRAFGTLCSPERWRELQSLMLILLGIFCCTHPYIFIFIHTSINPCIHTNRTLCYFFILFSTLFLCRFTWFISPFCCPFSPFEGNLCHIKFFSVSCLLQPQSWHLVNQFQRDLRMWSPIGWKN